MTKNLVFINNNQAVTSSLQVAEDFMKEHKHVIEAIKNLTVENSAVKSMFYEDEYTNSRGRKYPKYLMNRDGFTLLAMGFNGKQALEFKLKYINQFNEMENQIKNKLLPNTYKEALQALLIEVEKNEKLELENNELVKEVEYKEDVIVGLVDTITLSEKRQLINRVVREGGRGKIQERWTELYKQFESKYHINVKIRLNRYNENNKPKLKNKLDYIDKVMDKIPELYEIACKLYENDVKKLVEEMYLLQK